MATYSFISKSVLTGTANYIEFTSIPDTFTDLALLTSLRSNRPAINDQGEIKLNGTAVTGYRIYADGSNAGSDTDAYLLPPAGNATSNTFSNDLIYITNYAKTTQYKSIYSDGTMENDATGSYTYMVAGIYSANSAVSSVRITCLNGSWVAGSSVYLYGISNT